MKPNIYSRLKTLLSKSYNKKKHKKQEKSSEKANCGTWKMRLPYFPEAELHGTHQLFYKST